MAERAAIVTGASSGIGLALAHMLGQEGYGLTVASRRPEKLEPASKELADAGYTLGEEHGFLPHQYFLVFRPAPAGRAGRRS